MKAVIYTAGMHTLVRKMRTVSTIVALAALGVSAVPASPAPSLKRLDGINELKAWFNAGVGRPRLILLLSPT
jgi:hypothetical protein